MSNKDCPECKGVGGVYLPELGPNGDIIGIPCPTCSYWNYDDEVPCDYQIVANAAEVGKEHTKGKK